MGRPRRVWCRVCDRHVSECGPLSARGKCQDCGVGRMVEEIKQLAAHSGPHFDHWRKRGAASYGAILLDDL